MEEITLSLIIPTIGRPQLARALMSVRRQMWQPGDEVLLVGDGRQPVAAALWDQFKLPGRYIETNGPANDWGHTPRNLVMPQAKAAYLMALDDDDELTPGAIAVVRMSLLQNPGRPHMFRMSGDPVVGEVWKEKTVCVGNVGTPMFVLPRLRYGKPFPHGEYKPFHGGDCAFMQETLAMWPADSLVWREEVICKVRPM